MRNKQILEILKKERTQTEINELININPGFLCRKLKELENKKFIEKRIGKDKRVKHYKINKIGEFMLGIYGKTKN